MSGWSSGRMSSTASPMDFGNEPYEVGTVVAHLGNRSVTLAAEIRDPITRAVYATARTIMVGQAPLTEEQRVAGNLAEVGPAEIPVSAPQARRSCSPSSKPPAPDNSTAPGHDRARAPSESTASRMWAAGGHASWASANGACRIRSRGCPRRSL